MRARVGVGFRWFSRLFLFQLRRLRTPTPNPQPQNPTHNHNPQPNPRTHRCTTHAQPRYTLPAVGGGVVPCYGESEGLEAARRAVANVAVISKHVRPSTSRGRSSTFTGLATRAGRLFEGINICNVCCCTAAVPSSYYMIRVRSCEYEYRYSGWVRVYSKLCVCVCVCNPSVAALEGPQCIS